MAPCQPKNVDVAPSTQNAPICSVSPREPWWPASPTEPSPRMRGPPGRRTRSAAPTIDAVTTHMGFAPTEEDRTNKVYVGLILLESFSENLDQRGKPSSILTVPR